MKCNIDIFVIAEEILTKKKICVIIGYAMGAIWHELFHVNYPFLYFSFGLNQMVFYNADIIAGKVVKLNGK